MRESYYGGRPAGYRGGATSIVTPRPNPNPTLDCHSFPTEPLSTETATSEVRPDICIGTDAFHTPAVLVESLEHAFRAEGLTVHRDSPFPGTITPLAYLGKDSRVMSVMIEVRRDLYCAEATGERTAELARMRALLGHVVSFAVGQTIRERRAGSGSS